MDFIVCLPKSKKFTTIIVVVDMLSKYATLIPAPKECIMEDTTKLFFKHVVKYWGLPKSIISDQDSRFTGRFWTKLFKLIGSAFDFSISFHPQIERQTKKVNALLEIYLRHFVSANQHDWAKLLNVAQFSYNLQRSKATNKSPFDSGYYKQPLTSHTIGTSYKGSNPATFKIAKSWHEQADITWAYLDKSTKKMKWANKKRSCLNPYHEDAEDLGWVDLKRASFGNTKFYDKEMECVLADHVVRQKGHPLSREYFVKWKRLPKSEASWESKDALWQFKDKVQEFHKESTRRLRIRWGECDASQTFH
ncbi:uncharacterized protein LOC116134222 [Pistacia vera]|uniref:uncharacterized protein LOC116134222 n=1 Tax=Pistacia vera TaxID=55513 RepID=UPI0012630191|nr:uncharacterized protein LOC116134222 [Pistacia vera]